MNHSDSARQTDGYSEDVTKKPTRESRGSVNQSKITSLFMIEVIFSADGRDPKGRKNLTQHDRT
jgi:hypothetical protein